MVRNLEANRLRQCFEIFSPSDRRKLLGACLIQFSLSILDLIGVAMFGVLGSLAVSGVQSSKPREIVSEALVLFRIDHLTFQQQVAFLGITSAGFLILRTVLSIFLSRKILFFISRKGAAIATDLADKFFSRGLAELKNRSAQQNLYALTTGVQGITIGVIGTGTILVADISLLIVLLVGLFAVNILVATSTIIVFAIVGLLLYRNMHIRTSKLAEENVIYVVNGAEFILELIINFREYFVKNRRKNQVEKFDLNRKVMAETLAELAFLPTLSKYVVEASILLSALIISAIQFSLQDASQSVATLAVFLAAGSRIAPAALRLQQGLMTLKGNLAASELTLGLLEEARDWSPLSRIETNLDMAYPGFVPNIEVTNLSFTYSENESATLKKINLSIQVGKTLAVVGKSGAGKSTLVDAILGLIDPSIGSIKISGKDPKICLETWPGAVAYVPQETHILNGSLRSNICLGFAENEFSDEEILEVVKFSQLDQLVMELQNGLDTVVGEYGVGLSGGQLQRLGIARALITKPRLIVLDEATSSLDAQTEDAIGQMFLQLKGDVTIVLIAHRLSTARNADEVLYLANGEVKAIGTFDEVRKAVPDFDVQAKLMGL